MSENNKISGIVEGIIQDTETGETINVRHYLFCSGFELTTIAKIEDIESYEQPDAFQVLVDCNGLDSAGFVFRLGLNFIADSEAQKDRILNDLKVNSVFIFKGEYNAGKDTAPQHILLHNPHYEPVYPRFSEEEIRKVFSVNEKEQ